MDAMDAVLNSLKSLDGTVRSAVKLITGFTDQELNELGGFDEVTNIPVAD